MSRTHNNTRRQWKERIKGYCRCCLDDLFEMGKKWRDRKAKQADEDMHQVASGGGDDAD